jgi:hypothetical protein
VAIKPDPAYEWYLKVVPPIFASITPPGQKAITWLVLIVVLPPAAPIAIFNVDVLLTSSIPFTTPAPEFVLFPDIAKTSIVLTPRGTVKVPEELINSSYCCGVVEVGG